jgi:alkylhydroperoxidase family enzyme
MAWIRTVSDEEAEGRLAKIYEAAHKRAGRIFGIVRLMSLDPVTLQASMQVYQATTTSPRLPLPRWFRELVAVEVSRANDCFY